MAYPQTSAPASLSDTTLPTPLQRTASYPNQQTALPPPQSPQPTTPQKRKRLNRKPHILHQATLKKGLWIYFHLVLITPSTAAPPHPPSSNSPSDPSTTDLDPLTASSLLTPPLSAYLGLHGSAVPIDILKTKGADTWVRVPREDGSAFRASLSGWTGWCDGELVPGAQGAEGRVRVSWRVKGESEVLGGLDWGDGISDGGRSLFGS
ncbi:hypothetical protein CC78DRAFT_345410 [Lojkania enalia]|uniref:Ribonucleases P/MRP subunit Pop8-like domain-containing protein n=1 Tax=Lojkania enalia TaxID=147567 RepID=A0A9P4K309_9PLEO|nr:hypothetical protein CC78DRAFT_345410 [Didymosphaeria enalia]